MHIRTKTLGCHLRSSPRANVSFQNDFKYIIVPIPLDDTSGRVMGSVAGFFVACAFPLGELSVPLDGGRLRCPMRSRPCFARPWFLSLLGAPLAPLVGGASGAPWDGGQGGSLLIHQVCFSFHPPAVGEHRGGPGAHPACAGVGWHVAREHAARVPRGGLLAACFLLLSWR